MHNTNDRPNKGMKVVILCGGKGTRLREETEYRPKPMVDIGGKPILWHIMKLYAQYGFDDFVLCLGYRGHVIREYFMNYDVMNSDCTIQLGNSSHIVRHSDHQEANWKITLVDTGTETPKGGRILRIRPYVENSSFMLTYGDGIADIHIPSLIEHHRRSGKVVTFTGVNPRSRFATPGFDDRGEVVSWDEKKPLETFINGGFFVLEPRVFDFLTEDTEFEEQPMEELARCKQVSMYPHTGRWECMDTYRDYMYLNEMWNSGKAFWATPEERRPLAAAARRGHER